MTIESTVPLHRIAHSRTGDKGNRLNASLIAYLPELYRYLLEQVTAERVAELFAFRGPIAVRRYELPLLHALNFVIDDVLEGGVNGSLNLDGHGKTLSFLLLTLPVTVPAEHLHPAHKADSSLRSQ
ncbi:MAG: hypothetical protein IT518_04870 [Burkholderiales bacterium]|nr:hypothetical protein [Burkholderiales bacterium]